MKTKCLDYWALVNEISFFCWAKISIAKTVKITKSSTQFKLNLLTINRIKALISWFDKWVVERRNYYQVIHIYIYKNDNMWNLYYLTTFSSHILPTKVIFSSNFHLNGGLIYQCILHTMRKKKDCSSHCSSICLWQARCDSPWYNMFNKLFSFRYVVSLYQNLRTTLYFFRLLTAIQKHDWAH